MSMRIFVWREQDEKNWVAILSLKAFTKQEKTATTTTWKPDLTKCIIYWLSMVKIWIFMVDRPSNALQIQSRIISLLWKNRPKQTNRKRNTFDWFYSNRFHVGKLKTASKRCPCNALPIHIHFEVYALYQRFDWSERFATNLPFRQSGGKQGTKRK